MKKFAVRSTTLLLAAGLGLAAAASWSAESLQDVMKRRNLSQQDLLAASKTYVPTGKRDEFLAFSSGGQSGQIIVYGIPSMRILKYIGVFTPEPWQGYGFDESSKAVLARASIDGKDITWGDTHHPAISETQGKYDGQYPVHQRQGQPAPGGDRPARLRDQADRGQPDLQVRARRRLRHPEHRIHHRSRAVRLAAREQEVLSAGRVQREVSRRRHLLEVRPQGRSHRSEGVLLASNCRPTRRTFPTPARARPTAGPSPTPSAPSVTSVASRRAVRRMKPVAPPRTPTTCT